MVGRYGLINVGRQTGIDENFGRQRQMYMVYCEIGGKLINKYRQTGIDSYDVRLMEIDEQMQIEGNNYRNGMKSRN